MLISQIEKYDDIQEEFEGHKQQMSQLIKIKEGIRMELEERIQHLEKDKDELNNFINGQKVQYEIRIESLKNKITELADSQAVLQNQNQTLQEKQKEIEKLK